MPTQVTITTELTREGLQTVRDEIDALLANGALAASATAALSPASLTTTGSLDGLAVELKAHASSTLQRLVRFLVANYDGIPFTWDEVAAAMGKDVGSVKSWHRSLSKPLNRIVTKNPAAPRLLTQSWDGARNHYKLNPDWAEAIKRTW